MAKGGQKGSGCAGRAPGWRRNRIEGLRTSVDLWEADAATRLKTFDEEKLSGRMSRVLGRVNHRFLYLQREYANIFPTPCFPRPAVTIC